MRLSGKRNSGFWLTCPVLGERAMQALTAIQLTLDLDYAGIDFGLTADGSLLLFEANPTMAIVPPGSEPIWDYCRRAVANAQAAAQRLLPKNRLPNHLTPRRLLSTHLLPRPDADSAALNPASQKRPLLRRRSMPDLDTSLDDRASAPVS